MGQPEDRLGLRDLVEVVKDLRKAGAVRVSVQGLVVEFPARAESLVIPAQARAETPAEAAERLAEEQRLMQEWSAS